MSCFAVFTRALEHWPLSVACVRTPTRRGVGGVPLGAVGDEADPAPPSPLSLLSPRSVSLARRYAIWSGAGTLALALAGARLFGEAMGPARWASTALIVAGVVGLNVFG